MVCELELCLKCEVPGGCNRRHKWCEVKQAKARGEKVVMGWRVTMEERIRDLMRCGAFTIAQLCLNLGSDKTIRSALYNMQRRGEVVRYGDWKEAIFELAKQVE